MKKKIFLSAVLASTMLAAPLATMAHAQSSWPVFNGKRTPKASVLILCAAS